MPASEGGGGDLLAPSSLPTSSSRPGGPEIQLSLVFYSLLGGATAFIPLPFLDDWALKAVRRAMWSDILGRLEGAKPPKARIRPLFERESHGVKRGCLYQSLYLSVVYPFRIAFYILGKIFRKILFFLMVKQASDRASRLFHEGYLVESAVTRGYPADTPALRHLRANLELLLNEVTISPITAVFFRVLEFNRRLLYQASRKLVKLARLDFSSEASAAALSEVLWNEQRNSLDQLVRMVADLLAGEKGYLSQLNSKLESAVQVESSRPFNSPK